MAQRVWVNVMFCQAYTFGGYAFYPTSLAPKRPDRGGPVSLAL